MRQDDIAIEELVGVLIVEGQRRQVWVRSEPDLDGTWHNVMIFRRDGKLAGGDATIVGVEWHVPPGIALERAQGLSDQERLELYQRGLRPRPPLL